MEFDTEFLDLQKRLKDEMKEIQALQEGIIEQTNNETNYNNYDNGNQALKQVLKQQNGPDFSNCLSKLQSAKEQLSNIEQEMLQQKMEIEQFLLNNKEQADAPEERVFLTENDVNVKFELDDLDLKIQNELNDIFKEEMNEEVEKKE
ncbi:Hypothetical_protein [Hexamita inflata]|uniref:Hypothetical_protein n=1 Tax=Hexamita inflata TaxID=28002 RepID=A0AA86Q903_9EUKA|nr:Hypothetical protein HINF_LOCUS31833 [Hexamita inflata]CAI9954749.1 Hypothetical protein HINF_LOCUS42394 [Hexamita inflata]